MYKALIVTPMESAPSTIVMAGSIMLAIIAGLFFGSALRSSSTRTTREPKRTKGGKKKQKKQKKQKKAPDAGDDTDDASTTSDRIPFGGVMAACWSGACTPVHASSGGGRSGGGGSNGEQTVPATLVGAYDPARSKIGQDTRAQFLEDEIEENLSSVPGIGPATAATLGEDVGNTYQLIGMFLSLKDPSSTREEHCNKMYCWLADKGVNAHRAGIVTCLAEKCETFMPNMYR